jgi:hypothetical protein
MLDTMAYDLLLSRAELVKLMENAIAAGKIDLVQTHIQVSELEAIPDSKTEKRQQALAFSRSNTRNVPVGAFLIGISAIGDRIGNGLNIKVADVQTNRGGHTKDALIAVSADIEADILVTEDDRLRQRISQTTSKLQVWRFKEFERYLSGCSRDEGPADQTLRA